MVIPLRRRTAAPLQPPCMNVSMNGQMRSSISSEEYFADAGMSAVSTPTLVASPSAVAAGVVMAGAMAAVAVAAFRNKFTWWKNSGPSPLLLVMT